MKNKKMTPEIEKLFNELDGDPVREIAKKAISNMPDPKARCEITNAGRCGVCLDNGTFVPCS